MLGIFGMSRIRAGDFESAVEKIFRKSAHGCAADSDEMGVNGLIESDLIHRLFLHNISILPLIDLFLKDCRYCMILVIQIFFMKGDKK